MKRGLIITGGKIDLEFAGQYIKTHSFDCVVSVDGGLKYTKELGVMPNAIVGDLIPSTRRFWTNTGRSRQSFGMFISRRRMRPTQNLPSTLPSNWDVTIW